MCLRDVSGDHVLNKRESWRVKESLRASLVSYGAWPGDQGRFYSREAGPRVPASRRDAAAERKGGKSGLGDEEKKEREQRGRGRVGEGSNGGKERLCSVKERGTRAKL